MEILIEIVELSNQIVRELSLSGFFEENPFIDKAELKKKLQRRMQKKWEATGQMVLSENEFLHVSNEVVEDNVSKTLTELVDKGALDMGVNGEGDITFSINKDFDFDKNFNLNEQND